MMSKIKWKFYMLNIWKTRKKYSNFLIYTRYVFCISVSWQNVARKMQFIFCFSYLIVSGWTISSSNIGDCVGQWKGELSSLESGFGHWTHSVTRGHRSGQWDHFGPANSAGGKKKYKIIVFKNQKKCLIFKHLNYFEFSRQKTICKLYKVLHF